MRKGRGKGGGRSGLPERGRPVRTGFAGILPARRASCPALVTRKRNSPPGDRVCLRPRTGGQDALRADGTSANPERTRRPRSDKGRRILLAFCPRLLATWQTGRGNVFGKHDTTPDCSRRGWTGVCLAVLPDVGEAVPGPQGSQVDAPSRKRILSAFSPDEQRIAFSLMVPLANSSSRPAPPPAATRSVTPSLPECSPCWSETYRTASAARGSKQEARGQGIPSADGQPGCFRQEGVRPALSPSSADPPDPDGGGLTSPATHFDRGPVIFRPRQSYESSLTVRRLTVNSHRNKNETGL